MSESCPPEEHQPSVSDRFSTFIDTHTAGALSDEAGCRTSALIDQGADVADLIVLARYDNYPEAPVYHLTQTSSVVPHMNALTIIYDGEGFDMIAPFNTSVEPEIIADGILLSLEDRQAAGLLVPCDTPTA